MANLLLAALRSAGHEVTVVSRFRSYSATPELDGIRLAADEEIRRLQSLWGHPGASDKPDIWFTYHPYYRAPDLIGPTIARQLNIPYVTAEASYSSRRQADEWKAMQTPVVEAVRQALVNFCLTPIDHDGLGKIAAEDSLIDLPPFVDTDLYCGKPRPTKPQTPCRLITIAMMRPGVKVDSYAMLAGALKQVKSADWRLTIIGDGPVREDVEYHFKCLPEDRIVWLGEQPADQVREQLWQSDVFVWPGFGEAYGLAYLEAQACGLAVVAQDIEGVPNVVLDGHTGLLSAPGDVNSFANALDTLITDIELRCTMSKAASDFVRNGRTIEAAARIIDRELTRVLDVSGDKIAVT